MAKEVSFNKMLQEKIKEQDKVLEMQDQEIAKLKAKALAKFGSCMYISSYNDGK